MTDVAEPAEGAVTDGELPVDRLPVPIGVTVALEKG